MNLDFPQTALRLRGNDNIPILCFRCYWRPIINQLRVALGGNPGCARPQGIAEQGEFSLFRGCFSLIRATQDQREMCSVRDICASNHLARQASAARQPTMPYRDVAHC
jgi:hypothetical protein